MEETQTTQIDIKVDEMGFIDAVHYKPQPVNALNAECLFDFGHIEHLYKFKITLSDGRTAICKGLGNITDEALRTITDSPEYKALAGKATIASILDIKYVGKAGPLDNIEIVVSN